MGRSALGGVGASAGLALDLSVVGVVVGGGRCVVVVDSCGAGGGVHGRRESECLRVGRRDGGLRAVGAISRRGRVGAVGRRGRGDGKSHGNR